MKFHVENFKGPVLNKQLTKFGIIGFAIFYLILMGINMYFYSQTQKTVKVVVTKGQIVRNQIITEDNIQPYDMSEKEFLSYSARKTNIGYENRVVKWENRNSILGMFYAFDKPSEQLLFYGDIVQKYEDNSSLMLYTYPGKVLTVLDIQSQEVLAFKNNITVGDKINIDCSFTDTYQTIVGVRNTASKEVTGRSTIDIDTVVVDTVFNGVQTADILNGEGNSVLDYMTVFNNKNIYERRQIQNSEEFEKATKASKIVLALTPGQYKRYLQYRSKNNIKFWISIPQRENS